LQALAAEEENLHSKPLLDHGFHSTIRLKSFIQIWLVNSLITLF